MKTLANPDDRQEVLARLEGFRPDLEPRWGAMTAHQTVCHLRDTFEAGMGEREVSSRETRLPRVLVRWIALYAPFPWPKGIKTIPELDQTEAGSEPGDFAEDIDRLRKVVKRFCGGPPDFRWSPHPILGPMSTAQWHRWGYLHMDHHLRQFGL